ncbi:exosome complex protein Rrp42 [Methanobrevibacter wolinii]|uniref:exosome complex protein Rrp42 n=1 Tax=Methanobrevibacter wolinii TaxID=190977 RepID=UPI0005B25783|nr:exosome complex protein Rrp42 [Methanobrevibacter wolinii]
MYVTPEITKDNIVSLINDDKREDGRALDEYRDIEIETDIIPKAEGSAICKLGRTKVIAGIKPSLGEPFPDTPNLGVLMTNCELLPMADPEFEPGPPSSDSIELARVVDRGIRESEMVKLDELCVEEGKHVWILFIDIHVIDNCGNLFDCANLAVNAALKTCKLPKATIVDDEVVLDEENTVSVPLNHNVALSTFVKIGDKMLIDPSLDEEKVLSARLSVGITESGSICSMQKGGDKPLTKEEIFSSVKIALNKNKEILSNLN